MSVVGLVLLVLAFVGLQISFWPGITGAVQPAFLLALAVAFGLTTRVQYGFWLAFSAGLVLDFYAQQRFGTFTTAILAGYLVLFAYLGRRPSELSLGFAATLFLTASVIHELVILSVIELTTDNFPFFAELTQVATLNVAGSLAAFLLTYGALTALQNARRPRHERSLQF